jgi:hypothetical protein
MDPISSPTAGILPNDSASLRHELRALRVVVQISLVSLLIFGGSVGIYLFRQVTLVRRQAQLGMRTADDMLKNYQERVQPQAELFEKRLLEFARTNVEFQVRLSKYYPDGTIAAAAAAAAAAPKAPGTAPAAEQPR